MVLARLQHKFVYICICHRNLIVIKSVRYPVHNTDPINKDQSGHLQSPGWQATLCRRLIAGLVFCSLIVESCHSWRQVYMIYVWIHTPRQNRRLHLFVGLIDQLLFTVFVCIRKVQAAQWHEMYCYDQEVMSSNPSRVELGVLGISVLSRTWIRIFDIS